MLKGLLFVAAAAPHALQSAAAAAAAGSCGGGGQPACIAPNLIDGKFKCAHGHVSSLGWCIEHTESHAAHECGSEGQAACTGDNLIDGQFECAFGFIGSEGVCVPYTAMDDGGNSDSDNNGGGNNGGSSGGGGCGSDGQPVCTGDDLIDGQFECAFGFIGSEGVCVPYTPMDGGDNGGSGNGGNNGSGGCGGEGQPVCTGDDLIEGQFECAFGFIGSEGVCVPYTAMDDGGNSDGDNNGGSNNGGGNSSGCGSDGQPVCTGDDLIDGKFECAFGFIGSGGVCVPYTDDGDATPTPTPTPPTGGTPPPADGCGLAGADCCDGDVCEAGSVCNASSNLGNDPNLGKCIACGGAAGDRESQRACGEEGPCRASFEVNCNERGADICLPCGREGERCCNGSGAACTGALQCRNQVLQQFNGETVGVCEACGGDAQPACIDAHGEEPWQVTQACGGEGETPCTDSVLRGNCQCINGFALVGDVCQATPVIQ